MKKNGFVASRFLSSIMKSVLNLHYSNKETITKVEHLRILVTKQLDSMDLSSLMHEKDVGGFTPICIS